MKKTFDYKTDISIFLLLAIVLFLVAGIIFTLNVLRSDPIEEALAGENLINIFFILEHEHKPLGSYVIMYSPMNNRAAAISIPGDTGRILKTVDKMDRLDSVYLSNNIEPYKTEVEELLGLSISYSIVFETEKLAKIIDTIDGVKIFIPHSIEVFEEEIILFPSGNITLDGDKGIQYIVFELPEDESADTNLRRERFFLGLMKRLGEKNDLLSKPSIASFFYSLLNTRMNRLTQRKLFEALSKLDMDRINPQAVSGRYQEISGQRLLMPDYNGAVIRDVVRQAQRSLVQKTQGTLIERVFTVEILNGTVTTGLAARTADLIQSFNYDVIATGNATQNDYENTEIIDRTGIENAVNSFAAVIRCTNIRFESKLPDETEPGIITSESRADFTLILGKDFNGRFVTGN
ncbi:MAG: LCP family protein [Treponema sp.]|nr:LCP family protein [Treponema sp.]